LCCNHQKKTSYWHGLGRRHRSKWLEAFFLLKTYLAWDRDPCLYPRWRQQE
jgi:hypothetical protein